MSVKSSIASTSSASTAPVTQDLPVHGILRDERVWKPYFSGHDSSTVLHVNGEDINVGLGFLYDYYGMTDETQHGPPSPGSSPFSARNEDSKLNTEHGGDEEKKADKQATKSTMESKIHGALLECTRGSEASSSAGSLAVLEEARAPVESIVKAEEGSLSSSFCDSPAPVTVVSMDEKSQPLLVNSLLQYKPPMLPDDDRYINILEAPTSIIQRLGEDTLTYLNKGQFYAITCESTFPPTVETGKVKSVIYLVFRDEKDPRNESNHWQFWCSQQPNPNQRAFDIDRKACQNVDESINEVGYNAFAFKWNPSEKAKVVIRINCLSTDFSPQKGVKGIPLHLQVDTYEDLNNSESEPVHRGFCQIKVFRDKGAERKNKDESKSAERRLTKFMKQSPTQGNTSPISIFQGPNKVTRFYNVSPRGPKPWVFIPKTDQRRSSSQSAEDAPANPPPAPPPPPLFSKIRNQETKRAITAAVNTAKEDFEDLSVLPRHSKSCRVIKRKAPAVTIYVRKEEEKVYNALMLENLTVDDLKEAVAHKYGMPAEMIKNLYKKTRKGILVNMDDMMVEQFVDEDDFLIQVNFDNQLGHFELTFVY